MLINMLININSNDKELNGCIFNKSKSDPLNYSNATFGGFVQSCVAKAKLEYETKENNSDIKKLEKRIMELEKQVERINELENQLKEIKGKK